MKQSFNLKLKLITYTAKKEKFSIKGFLSKCDQIRSSLRIWSYVRKRSLMENFIFGAVMSQITRMYNMILSKKPILKLVMETSRGRERKQHQQNQ